MATSKEKNRASKENEDVSSINKNKNDTDEEIYSDGSGEAFEQTEEVNEDNFDDLKEK
jgi:hypothetical protein